ncbi:Hydroquinone glucosyltransferase [Vitis vinifera]|nr:Hydroquinone glucosyltransferase [Vitis vinifera]
MCGVPLIAWPLYSEQKMNAVMLTEGLQVALRPEVNKSGLVQREEIVRVVKDLMTGGHGVRIRAKELKEAATKALCDDGSSSKALLEFVLACKNKIGR